MQQDNRPWISGLSLIEVVISLFLLSIMSVIILGSYNTGLGIWNDQRTQGITHDNTRAVIKRIRSQIKSAYPWDTLDEDTSKLYFKGEPNALQFASLVGLSSKRGNGLVHIVSYCLERGSDGTGGLRVEEYSWPRRGFPENEDPVIAETINEIVDFSCKYLIRDRTLPLARVDDTAKADDREGEEWVSAWPAAESDLKKTGILAAVSIDITAQTDHGSREQFSLIIPVRLTIEGSSPP